MTRDFPNTEVGFIGIGKLGFPLAKRISESGLKVNAFDIQEKYSEKCNGTNITFIKKLEDITKTSDIFFSYPTLIHCICPYPFIHFMLTKTDTIRYFG